MVAVSLFYCIFTATTYCVYAYQGYARIRHLSRNFKS